MTATLQRLEAYQVEEIVRCVRSCAYFLRTYAKVSDPETLQTLDFELWPHLAYLLDLWQRERLCIVLKARQLGVSWLLAGYALWKSKFHSNANTLLLSKGQDDATDLLSKARFIEDTLPDWLQNPRGKDNGSELEFPQLGARVRALPSTPNAGRGNTASLVIPDEFAFHAYSRENYLALMPTLGSRGQMLIVSTANGIANLYQELWKGADPLEELADRGDGVWTLPDDEVGPNGFAPVFLHWSCRPGRDEAWIEAQRAVYDDPKMFKQEFPSNPVEAFVTSGSLVFDAEALERVHVSVTPLSPRAPGVVATPMLEAVQRLQISAGPALQVYGLPERTRRSLIGADVAQGLGHGDASCAVVLAQTAPSHFEEVAHYHTNLQPDIFAAGLHLLATAYPAQVGIERNGPGHQVVYKLRELRRTDTPYHVWADPGDPRRSPAGLIPGQTGDAALEGWTTSGASKATAVGELDEAIRNGWVTIHSRLAYEQLRMFQRLPDGKTQAPPTKHDDCVMAWAIAWQMRKWPIASGPQAVNLNLGPSAVLGNRRPDTTVVWPQ